MLLKKYVDHVIIISPKEKLENTFAVFNNIRQEIQYNCVFGHEIDEIKKGSEDRIFYQKSTDKGLILKTSTAHSLFRRILA